MCSVSLCSFHGVFPFLVFRIFSTEQEDRERMEGGEWEGL